MKFRVSMAQLNPTSGDLEGNCRKIVQAIDRARRDTADAVVLPEMCLTGYCLDEKLLINREFLERNETLLREEIVPACRGLTAVVGFVDFDPERRGPDGHLIRHNAAAIIEDGCLRQIVHKRLLPSYRYFDDKRYFTPGREAQPVTIRVRDGTVRIGVLICEDLWDEGYEFQPCETYCARGVDYLFCINASPFVASSPGQRDGKRFVRERLARSHIQQFGVPILLVNTVGVGDNGKNIIPFDGFSCAYDRDGELVACLGDFQENQQCVDYDDGKAPRIPDPGHDREEEIYRALVMGVRDYYEKVGIFQGVLEAVSGGIDSALGAAIAFDAVGREKLTLYNLPSRFNRESTRNAAEKLARNFGLEYRVIPIQDKLETIVRNFETHLHPIRNPVTLENLQARIRGLIMMAESNDRGALLLTNGNETEIALGYATLYGDMVGGLAVIGDLAKPDVYRLARYVNRRWEREMIPQESLQAVPSAELSEGQHDPFDYDVVGPVVSDFIEHGWSPRQIQREFRQRRLSEAKYPGLYDRYDEESFAELTRKLYATLNRTVYKRVQAAPIIVVSERSFGFDLRETIINGWNG